MRNKMKNGLGNVLRQFVEGVGLGHKPRGGAVKAYLKLYYSRLVKQAC
jgi:hypothetical protein